MSFRSMGLGADNGLPAGAYVVTELPTINELIYQMPDGSYWTKNTKTGQITLRHSATSVKRMEEGKPYQADPSEYKIPQAKKSKNLLLGLALAGGVVAYFLLKKKR